MWKNKLLDQPLYRRWINIKQRCYNPKNPAYKYYGGRGIKMCNEWVERGKGYKRFYNWSITNGYEECLTLDRIDVNGNYEPNNCRWVTMAKQSLNKRNTYYVNYKGEKITLMDLSKQFGINYFTLHTRLKSNKLEDCIKNNFTGNKKSNTGEFGISYSGGYYIVYIKHKYYGNFKKIEDAIQTRNHAYEKEKELFLEG